MIDGIGMDMIEVDRVLKACQRDAFLNRYYTEAERELIWEDRKKAAGNFAVKEAVVKVFGTGFRDIAPIEIEVLRDTLGCPYVNLYGKAKEKFQERGYVKIHVTITNTKEFASAVAIGERV